MAHTATAIGIAPLVRVRGVDDPDVSLLLDNGVAGIIYPDIATADEARKAVDICKFPPIGRRSVVVGYPHFHYRTVPLKESVPQLNEACLLVCMIESVAGLNNVEEIGAAPGVDVVYLGSDDLLADMGKLGQFDDPDIVAAQDWVVKAARANGIFAGCGETATSSGKSGQLSAARNSSPRKPISDFCRHRPANGRARCAKCWAVGDF
jgi:staphyloferrin B biosynthesis citrate synthase